MQVTAEVVRAEPAWDGLTAAQEAARTVATTSVSYQAMDLGLSRIVVDPPATPALPSSSSDPRLVSVVIQYLRN
jgi:hypothetical protein